MIGLKYVLKMVHQFALNEYPPKAMKQSFLLFIILSWSACLPAQPNDRPNIIVFLADDFGYGSTNAYGASKELIETPNIDYLAKNGVKFTNAYTTGSVCSPTRYALLTGRYSWRTEMKTGVVNTNGSSLIDLETQTLPEYLREKGYINAAIGKWHLGFKSEPFDNLLGNIYPGPNDHGFDYSFVVPNNLDDIHKVYVENNEIYGLRSDKISAYGKSFYGKQYTGYDAPQRVTENVMDHLVDKSIEWLDGLNGENPFFLYFASVAVHHPITPSPYMRGKSNAGAYGDFIQDIDRSLGLLLLYLEKTGQRENTLIIFMSDNGGDIPDPEHRGFETPENFAINKGLEINGALRGDKHTIWDGGFKIPFIVNQPGKIEQNVSNATVATIDVFAFIADYIGKESDLPKDVASDSESFAQIISNPKSNYERPPLVHRDAKGRKAVRFGDWKYIEAAPDVKTDSEAMLFNYANDPAESTNLINRETTKSKEGAKYLRSIVENQ